MFGRAFKDTELLSRFKLGDLAFFKIHPKIWETYVVVEHYYNPEHMVWELGVFSMRDQCFTNLYSAFTQEQVLEIIETDGV